MRHKLVSCVKISVSDMMVHDSWSAAPWHVPFCGQRLGCGGPLRARRFWLSPGLGWLESRQRTAFRYMLILPRPVAEPRLDTQAGFPETRPFMSHPVADYLHELYLIPGVSVPETSGYPALSKLLNAVGDSLKPKITAVIHPSNNGAGIPDGGLFSAKELKNFSALWSWRGGKAVPGERHSSAHIATPKDLASYARVFTLHGKLYA